MTLGSVIKVGGLGKKIKKKGQEKSGEVKPTCKQDVIYTGLSGYRR